MVYNDSASYILKYPLAMGGDKSNNAYVFISIKPKFTFKFNLYEMKYFMLNPSKIYNI